MDPGDAADALADLEYDEEEDAARPAETQGPDRVATTIRVNGNFRSVEIIGDAGVREAVAEGPHRTRWEGDVLVVDGTSAFDDDDDDLEGDDGEDGERPYFGEWFRANGARNLHRARMAYGRTNEHKPRPLRVRMNPNLPLEARIEAGPLTIRGVHAPVNARVAAGHLIIEDFVAPIDLRVAAGKVSATGRLTDGVSTIDCDAGKIRLHLTHGSDARVNASATLGKIDFGGRSRSRGRDRFDWQGLRDGGEMGDMGERLASVLNSAFSDDHEVVVGQGTAEVDVRVSMGSADITFDDTPKS